MRFKINSKFIFQLTATLLLVIFLAGGFIWISIRIVKSKSSLVILNSEIKSLENKRAMLREAENVLSEKKEKIERLENFLVNRKRPIKFIKDLEELARRTGNKISLGIDENSPPSTLIFRIVVKGSRASVFKYLRHVTFLPYDIEVNEISFQKVSSVGSLNSKTEEPKVSARLLMVIKVKTD